MSEGKDRVATLYPNQGVHSTAYLMAKVSEHAISYMEQAPVLLVFASWGRETRTGADRAVVANRFGSAIHKGGKLKEVMARVGASYPLRSIAGGACIPSNFPAIMNLQKVPPSVLAQSIPDRKQQPRWFRILKEFLIHWNHKGPFNPHFNDAWEWIVYAGAQAIREGVVKPEDRIGDIVDYVVRGRNAINQKWTFRGALKATERWHRELAQKQDQAKFLAQHGFSFTDRRDYAPLPSSIEVCDFTFVALDSGLELFVEGAQMRHCVSRYVRDVMLGGTRIYSIRRGDDRIATMELHPRGERFVMAQLKGPCNTAPNKLTRSAAEFFVQTTNSAIGKSRAA